MVYTNQHSNSHPSSGLAFHRAMAAARSVLLVTVHLQRHVMCFFTKENLHTVIHFMVRLGNQKRAAKS